MKVRFTSDARRQYLEVLEYIRNDNPSAAGGFHRRVRKILRRLEKFPGSGRAIPGFPDLPHREVILNPCRFFCLTEGKTVRVVGVLHGARDLEGQ